MTKFKLFPNENYDQQIEKHNAYLKVGFQLVSQRENKKGIIKRTYKR